MVTLYELTPINNVSGNTGMHTFHIIGICPLTNTPVTLHTSVPLCVYSTLHIDPTELQKLVE